MSKKLKENEMINVEIKEAKKMSKEEALDLKRKCEAILAFLKEFYFKNE